jgi:hypothetical protein
MNIFVLDLNTTKCASFHNDRHCSKMILESTQMLSTACRLSGVNEGYKVAYQNHPCSIWCRTSLYNWLWLRDLVIDLNSEWKRRFNHTNNHKSYEVTISLSYPKIKDIGFTSFAQAMPDEYKSNDPVKAYRNYYMGDKRHLAQWKNGEPWWWR